MTKDNGQTILKDHLPTTTNHQPPAVSSLPSTVYHNLLTLFTLVLLTACGGAEAETATPLAIATLAATPTAEIVVKTGEPLTAEDAQPPVRLSIPAINLAVAVVPMAWQVTEFAGERSAVWQVPTGEAGWHINSAGAGALGNVVISGHHLQGAAVFAALARGEVAVGQTVQLNDAQGRAFVYQVTEISPPIPALAATEQDMAQAAAYVAMPTPPALGEARLTLATGWPEFSDTHYIFVVATLVGQVGGGQ